MTTAAQHEERVEQLVAEIAEHEEFAEKQRKAKARPRQLHAELHRIELEHAREKDMSARALEVAAVELFSTRAEALRALEQASETLERVQVVRRVFDAARRQADAHGVEPSPDIAHIAVGTSPERKRIIEEFRVRWTGGIP